MYGSGAEVAYHLTELQAKIDKYAAEAGVSALDRLDLRTTLAALSWPDRRHLGIVLGGARALADSPAQQEAISQMLRLATEVWTDTPPPSEFSELPDPCLSGGMRRRTWRKIRT
jgi:hypothetical protein